MIEAQINGNNQPAVEQAPPNPEQQADIGHQALDALAEGHDNHAQQIEALQAVIAQMQGQIDSLRGQAEPSSAVDSPEQASAPSSPETETKEKQKPDSVRDLERLAEITGRPVDDPELIKLNLRLKAERFDELTKAYDAQEGTVRQEGFLQDVATAKRELEEAMYLYDPKFAEMDQQLLRTKAVYDRTTDPEEKRKLREELFRLKDVGSVSAGNEDRPGGSPRRDEADRLTTKLGDISASLEGSEILATYNAHKSESPEEPFSSRRRTDTETWSGKPEYDSNGMYIGYSPARTGSWTLEPKAPLELSSVAEAVSNEEPITAETETPAAESEETGAEVDSEAPTRMEVPPVNTGNYPELYARRKNLVGGDQEALKAEADRVSAELTANVEARVNNFMVDNPNASPEQIRQFSLTCYVEAQSALQQDVIAAVDGRGYTDASGVERGKSGLRRFGSWLDKHGSKIKKGMLIVGVVGAVAITGGVAAGVIVPAFALGAGTAIGAAKGASIALGMSRHGSKESSSRSIDVSNESYQTMFEQMSPADATRFARMSDYIMNQYNAAADTDHAQNVRKSRRAAVTGAVIGAIAGSITFSSPQVSSTPNDTIVPNTAPDIPHHTIQPGELTGQVINKTLSQMGIDGSRFVNADGSTNMQALFDVVPKSQWHSVEALANGTHSVAGADNLSNEGIRYVIQSVVNNHDWGTQVINNVSSSTELVPNLPVTIATWVTGAILAAGFGRQAAEERRRRQSPQPAAPAPQTSTPPAQPSVPSPAPQPIPSAPQPVAPIPAPAPQATV